MFWKTEQRSMRHGLPLKIFHQTLHDWPVGWKTEQRNNIHGLPLKIFHHTLHKYPVFWKTEQRSMRHGPPLKVFKFFPCLKPMIPGSNPDRRKIYLVYTSSSSAAGPTHPSIQWVMEVITPEQSSLGMRFSAYLNLFPNLRMGNSTPPYILSQLVQVLLFL